jgi:hypothetical protein
VTEIVKIESHHSYKTRTDLHSNNVFKINLDTLPSAGYHITFCSQSPISVDDYGKTLTKMGLYMTEIEGAYKYQEPNTWYIWFK